MTNLVAYWHVSDIEAKLSDVTAAVGTLKGQFVTCAVATFTDADGNELALLKDP
jgi:predicted enzyme related to lactoylglutathione lyase